MDQDPNNAESYTLPDENQTEETTVEETDSTETTQPTTPSKKRVTLWHGFQLLLLLMALALSAYNFSQTKHHHRAPHADKHRIDRELSLMNEQIKALEHAPKHAATQPTEIEKTVIEPVVYRHAGKAGRFAMTVGRIDLAWNINHRAGAAKRYCARLDKKMASTLLQPSDQQLLESACHQISAYPSKSDLLNAMLDLSHGMSPVTPKAETTAEKPTATETETSDSHEGWGSKLKSMVSHVVVVKTNAGESGDQPEGLSAGQINRQILLMTMALEAKNPTAFHRALATLDAWKASGQLTLTTEAQTAFEWLQKQNLEFTAIDLSPITKALRQHIAAAEAKKLKAATHTPSAPAKAAQTAEPAKQETNAAGDNGKGDNKDETAKKKADTPTPAQPKPPIATVT